MADLTPEIQQLQNTLALDNYTNSVKKEADKEKKLGDSPATRSTEVQPWNLFGWVDNLGGQEIRHIDPKTPSTFFLEKLHPNGSTETHETSESEGAHSNELHAGHHRQYVAKGKHDHADGNHASSTSANRHIDTKKDTGIASGSNIYNGAGQKIIGGSGQGSFHNNTGGETFHTSSGDVVHSHEGNLHQEHVGDHVRSIVGNSIEMVGTGDHGIHVQTGNFDLTATLGKGKVKSGQLLTLESPTSILINAGILTAGSTILMTPATIAANTPTLLTANVGASSIKMVPAALSANVGTTSVLLTPGTITSSIGASKIIMSPSSITASVGTSSIAITAASITLTVGTSTIAITPALIEILSAAGSGPIRLNN